MTTLHPALTNIPNPFRKNRYANMEATLRQWHDDSLDDAEYLYLEPNFEQMADAVHQAAHEAQTPRDMTPDDSWVARQNKAAA